MYIKVCGITEKTNPKRLKGKVNFLGFIFYPPSPRNAFNVEIEKFKNYKKDFEIVGVFVDCPYEELIKICNERDIQTVQLHGKESIDYIKSLKKQGFKIIKSISISKDMHEESLQKIINEYKSLADIILFDTKGQQVGGNGYKFDWGILQEINLSNPYFLSGGISENDADEIIKIKNRMPFLSGLDLNSRFELSPGEKDIDKILEFINKLNKSE